MGAPGLAPATYLTLPRLSRVPEVFEIRHGDRAAARLARVLLETGIGKPCDWQLAEGDTREFARLTIERQVHDVPLATDLSQHLQLLACISSSPDADSYAHFEPPKMPGEPTLYLSLQAELFRPLAIGYALPALLEVHPRMASTWYDWLFDAVGQFLRVWTLDDARDELVSRWEFADDMEEEGEMEGPRPDDVLPKELQRRPLALRTVKALLQKHAGTRAGSLIACAIEVHELVAGYRVPEWPKEWLDPYMEAPLAGIALTLDEADEIAGLWDEVADVMGQSGPMAPSSIWHMDLTRPETVRRAFDELRLGCRVLGLVAAQVPVIEGSDNGVDPATLAVPPNQTLAEVFAADAPLAPRSRARRGRRGRVMVSV